MKRHRLGFLVVCLCTTLAPALAGAQPPDLAERINAYVQPFLEDGHLSGTLLVARDGQVIFEKSWGMADREQGIPNTPETAFLTASVTKPMTVMVASRLVDDDRLNVEDSLRRWLPDFSPGNRITVEQLLGHQAGIAHQLTEKDDRTARRSASDMVALASSKPLAFEPGSETEYSSGGYSVLARVLELAGRDSYADLLRKRVFGPAGMDHSRDATAGIGSLDVAPSYRLVPGGLERTAEIDYSYLVGAGSVYSTPGDLHRLVRALLAGTLGEAARDVLVRSDGMRWNGRTDGYRCFVDYDAVDDLVVIFAGNVLSGAIDRLRADVPAIARGGPVATPEPLALEPVTLGAELLARYAGAYRLRPGFDIQLYVEDGILFASDWLLIPTSETSFFSPSDYGTIEVVFAADGETVERIDWTVDGQAWPCPRVLE